MSFPKRAIAVLLDLQVWFWLGKVPGWYTPGWWRKSRKAVLHTQHGDIAAERSRGGTLLFDRRSMIPVSPAAPTAAQMTAAFEVASALAKLGPQQREVSRAPRSGEGAGEGAEQEPDTVPVDLAVAEKARLEHRGRVSVDSIESGTALLRVIGEPEQVWVENPCVACGKESTSALLDRCSEHDGALLLSSQMVPSVMPLSWVTGHTTGEFEALLDKELARATRLT